MTTNQCINGTREIKHYQFVACCCFALFCFVCGSLCVRACVCSIRHGESLKIV